MPPDPAGLVKPRTHVRPGTLTSQRAPRACSGNTDRIVISLIELPVRVAEDRRRRPSRAGRTTPLGSTRYFANRARGFRQ